MRLSAHQVVNRRYRILSPLGQGGTSEVYLAWDEKRSVNVALKLLLEQNSVASLAAFQNEAQALTLLKHPNIVNFYGMEQDADNLFLVMDYVAGRSLSEEIRAAKPKGLPWQRILEILKPICSALNFAHQKNIVHCDIKPGNILIRSQGEILLADFGIARYKGEISAALQGAGTLTYMSPEQIQGLPPTPQMDIYSLGVILYEMAAGQRPFGAQQTPDAAVDRERLRWEQINLAPPSPRFFRPDLPLEAENVILKCLAKDPRHRFENTLQLFQAFEQAFVTSPDAHPAGAGRPGRLPLRVPHQPRARRYNMTALSILAGLTLTVLLVLGGFAWFNPSPVSPAPSTDIPTLASLAGGGFPTAFDYSGKCATFIIPQKNDAQIEECVTRIEVQPDETMKVYFQWRLRSVTMDGITISSDEGNSNMYLLDDQNRRLNQFRAGGQANEAVMLINGQAKQGWFLFPAPPADARSFSFHDDDNHIVILGIERRW